jgi:hypothetical protein
MRDIVARFADGDALHPFHPVDIGIGARIAPAGQPADIARPRIIGRDRHRIRPRKAPQPREIGAAQRDIVGRIVKQRLRGEGSPAAAPFGGGAGHHCISPRAPVRLMRIWLNWLSCG